MRYLALATDYDGTIAAHGDVDAETVCALKRFRDVGRRLILVTGRHLEDLRRVFPDLGLFDLVVVENGAVLYDPHQNEQTLLSPEPPPALVAELKRRAVVPLDVGRGIVATWSPHETTVLGVIRELGLEHQVIFNKGAVMVLAPGVNKASGLRAALAKLDLSPHNVVGVGDAENDHAFLQLCGFSVAVENALQTLKSEVDWVTAGPRGRGVVELIDRLLASEGDPLPGSTRHRVKMGEDLGTEAPVYLPGSGENLLIAGASGSGKSTTMSAILEGMAKEQFQFCLVDPEGDFDELRDALVLGGAPRTSELDEVQSALAKPDHNVAVNLLALPLLDRPQYFEHLLLRIQELRARTGRPHWLVVEEAHHTLPAAGVEPQLPRELRNVIFVTVRPDHLSPSVLPEIAHVVTTGREAKATLEHFFRAIGHTVLLDDTPLEAGQGLYWTRHAPDRVVVLKLLAPTIERKRHRRKYAQGRLGEDKSFYFRGPEGELNLRAHNLSMFVELARGVDEGTWRFHLRQCDYSAWIADCIKDEALADHVRAIEAGEGADTRQQVIDVILEHYTLPE